VTDQRITEIDKNARSIRTMFAEAAPRYDLLNRLLSASLDDSWRARCAAALETHDSSRVLDLCCGTGDQAITIQRRMTDSTVVASDFCLPMLALARRKFRPSPRSPHSLAGDALSLPFPSGLFDAVTVSFGLRNVADLEAALVEILRVLRPGGRALFLEFALPTSPWLKVPYGLYLRGVLPLVGALVSPRPAAYRYLPRSVAEFPQRSEFVAQMVAVGFDETVWEDLTGGIVCLYTGVAR
jgi:demethylmenaquinone methyltransferase/2-methoxy-6-polyprenyl-1,4-benzoquinol methylase